MKALQLVIDGLGPTPKIKSGCDVHDIVAACKGFLRQPGSHLQVLMGSMKVITLLAEGMRCVLLNCCYMFSLTYVWCNKCTGFDNSTVQYYTAVLYYTILRCMFYTELYCALLCRILST